MNICPNCHHEAFPDETICSKCHYPLETNISYEGVRSNNKSQAKSDVIIPEYIPRKPVSDEPDTDTEFEQIYDYDQQDVYTMGEEEIFAEDESNPEQHFHAVNEEVDTELEQAYDQQAIHLPAEDSYTNLEQPNFEQHTYNEMDQGPSETTFDLDEYEEYVEIDQDTAPHTFDSSITYEEISPVTEQADADQPFENIAHTGEYDEATYYEPEEGEEALLDNHHEFDDILEQATLNEDEFAPVNEAAATESTLQEPEDAPLNNMQQEKSVSDNIPASQLTSEATYGEDYMLQSFVGKKYDSYYDKKWLDSEDKNGISFNIFALLFGVLWLGFRKMYLPIAIISLLYLFSNIVHFLIGYEYSYFLSSPLDKFLAIFTIVALGGFGNAYYKWHAEKQIQKIYETTPNLAERQALARKKGGRSWAGIFLSLLIMITLYSIPTYFIPSAHDPLEIIQETTLVYTAGETNRDENISLKTLTNQKFTSHNWSLGDKVNRKETQVIFTGINRSKGEMDIVTITFNVNKYTEETLIDSIAINKKELVFSNEKEIYDFLLNLRNQ